MTSRRTFLGGAGATLMSGGFQVKGQAAEAQARRDTSDLLPFLFWHDDTIVVPVTINRIKTAAIIDSGAAVSMIDRRFADAANIPVTSVGQSLAGPGGRLQAPRTAPFQIAVGHVVAPLAWAALVDLASVSEAMGWPVGFLLGQDILRAYVFDFDFHAKRFAIAPNSLSPYTSGLVKLTLGRGIRQEPTVEISIEGNPPISAAVDTGNSSPLLLSPTYAAQAGLESRRISTALSATANGLSTNKLVSLKTVQMEGVTVQAVPAEIYSAWTSNGSPANIGMPMLASRRLVLDFGHDGLWRSPESAALRRDRSGLGLAVKSDRLVVMHVAAGSPAGAGGWKVSDQIAEVDGHPIDQTYNSGSLWRWRYGAEGTLVHLKLADGSDRTLRLSDYY